MKERTTLGRPRRYGTNAEKIDAFRSRQESAGYLRREVLVTRATAERLNGLASTHGVSSLDVGSALLELGLAEFEKSELAAPLRAQADAMSFLHAPEIVARSRSAAPPVAAKRAIARDGERDSARPAAQAPAQSDAQADSNPILRFFARRKESLNK